MENNQEKEYDFFAMGMRKAKDVYEDLTRNAENIGKQFGEQARLEFECGVAVALSTNVNKKIDDIQRIVSKDSEIHAKKI